MSTRTIKSLENGRTTNVGTIHVQELLPNKDGFFDPFLVFHHGSNKINKDIPFKQQGVDPHPHRGFSPITFVYKGGVLHRDSFGNEQTVYAGGTQWMNVGKGVIHSERVPQDIFEHGGEQEILQVWVNTPAKFKMEKPEYFPLTKEETPTVTSADGLVQLLVPAGKLENVQGKIPTTFPVTAVMGEAKKGGTYTFKFPQSHNALLYVLRGELVVNDKEHLWTKTLAFFNNDGEEFTITANADTEFFVGAGEPLNEPIEAYGPFVMNNQTQIMEAMRDYQMGKMGVLIED